MSPNSKYKEYLGVNQNFSVNFSVMVPVSVEIFKKHLE